MDKTLLKGLTILETISNLDDQVRNLDQIAEIVGLSRSNTHRTLQTLSYAGYIEKDSDTGSYRCTLKMFELGTKRLANMDIRKLARPFMRSLAEATSETVHLSVLDGLDVVYIDKLDCPTPIQAYSMIGGRAPAYAVATGKALLAFETSNYIDRFPSKLKRYTSATQSSVQTLKSELSEIAHRGYAINRGEWREGLGGVAAPIFNGLDKSIAALGISGLLERLTVSKMTEFAPLVLQAAQELSRNMGYRGAFFETHR